MSRLLVRPFLKHSLRLCWESSNKFNRVWSSSGKKSPYNPIEVIKETSNAAKKGLSLRFLKPAETKSEQITSSDKTEKIKESSPSSGVDPKVEAKQAERPVIKTQDFQPTSPQSKEEPVPIKKPVELTFRVQIEGPKIIPPPSRKTKKMVLSDEERHAEQYNKAATVPSKTSAPSSTTVRPKATNQTPVSKETNRRSTFPINQPPKQTPRPHSQQQKQPPPPQQPAAQSVKHKKDD